MFGGLHGLQSCLGISNSILGLDHSFSLLCGIQILNLLEELLGALHHGSALGLLQEEGDFLLFPMLLIIVAFILKHSVHLLGQRCHHHVTKVLQIPAVGLVELTHNETTSIRWGGIVG